METLNKGLAFLLNKYSVEKDAFLKSKDVVVIDGVEVPLLAERAERRFIELKNIVTGGTLVNVSVMRVARIIEKGSDIYDALYRELDICQFVLDRKIATIMVMQNDNVLNAIAKTEDGVVCTIEISATLKKGEKPIDKHEIISERGIACDTVVDAQLKQDSIYIFGEENEKYTDVDFELYGMSTEDIAVVRAAFSIAQNNTENDMIALDRELKVLVEKARLSASSGERQVI